MNCELPKKVAVGETTIVSFETAAGVWQHIRVTVVKQLEDKLPTGRYSDAYHCYRARVDRHFRRMVGSKWLIVAVRRGN